MPSSVEALVAQRVGEVHDFIGEANGRGDRVWPGDAGTLVELAGLPALVEALAPFVKLAELADRYGHEPGSSCSWRIAYDDLARARAALGGEQVQGRAELEADPTAVALEHIWAARVALRRGTTGSRLSAYVQSFVDEARESLKAAEHALSGTPTPTTPKGAE